MRTVQTIPALLALGLISCGLVARPAEAVQISGEISFLGNATVDPNSLGTATRVTQFSNRQGVAGSLSVASATGSFSSIPLGSFAAFTAPYVFNSSSANPNFWQVGGFTFNLLSSTVIYQNPFYFEVQGTGIFTGNGYDPTPGTWNFSMTSADGPNKAFGFGFAPAALPESGAALLYLGIAFTCLEAFRRKFAAV